MTITIVNIETTRDACVLVGPREKREALRVDMIARLFIREGHDPAAPRRTPRREFPWVRIVAIKEPPAPRYTAILVSETMLDIDDNHEFQFGPEHVCEWGADVQRRKVPDYSRGYRGKHDE